jgi:hypothetical protein
MINCREGVTLRGNGAEYAGALLQMTAARKVAKQCLTNTFHTENNDTVRGDRFAS